VLPMLLAVLAALLVGLGCLLLAAPVFLAWWIHGSPERYLRIISGPFPYDRLGSGPLQLWLGVALVCAGLVALAAGRALRAWLARRRVGPER
jgi:hypothetical protein